MTTTAPSLYPILHYKDSMPAIDFLERAFGFRRLNVIPNPDGTVLHADLALGHSILMIGGDADDPRLASRPGQGWLYVAVDDVDAHCERARREGARIIMEPFETPRGSKGYTALDPEGNQWHFGTDQPVPDAPA